MYIYIYRERERDRERERERDTYIYIYIYMYITNKLKEMSIAARRPWRPGPSAKTKNYQDKYR